MNETTGLRTWIEVSKKALDNNYREFRKLIKPECKLMAIAKSNAYGHGLVDYAKTMTELGADWIGVDSITEAMRLRKEGIGIPILVLGYTLPENLAEAVENNISLTISSFDSLDALQRFFAGTQNDKSGLIHDSGFMIHVKVDTGMHRQGFQLDEFEKAVKFIKESLLNVQVEGAYTHFAAAKDPSFPDETNAQIEQFKEAAEILKKYGFNPICHAAATSGTIVFPESHFDMVRIGIGLMGLWPSSETKDCFIDKINLIPALTWRTIISEIKTVKAGERIGYDFTETLSRDSKIAILPVGYWHGYRRDLSGIGHVIVRGKKAKILGRISMDMITIDVTDIENTAVGDHVTLIGSDGDAEVSAYELAELSNTSWYETITQINPLIKKIYI